METLHPHFDGRRFCNLVPRRNKYLAVLRWLLSRQRGAWRRWTDAPPGPPPPPTSDRLRVSFVNHTTFLIQLSAINVLTDPIWSERASPVSWVGPRRHRPPGIRWEDLPPIDLVLLSHDHHDHMDLPTLRRLSREHGPTIYAGLGNKRQLAKHGIGNVVELDWWQEVSPRSEVWLTAVPAQHFSGRSPFRVDKSLWCGFVLQAGETTVYFAGDTGKGPHIPQIANRFPEIDLGILPIGAFRPQWFMGEMHMSPADAVEAHLELGARFSLASHFGTFDLADDGEDEPVEVLREILQHTDLRGTEFEALDCGEGRELPARAETIQQRSEKARNA